MALALGPVMKTLWQHPLVRNLDVNTGGAVEAHRRMIEAKPLLHRQHMKWYKQCLAAYEDTKHLKGLVVEIGSGAGFLEKVIPDVIKTDIVPTRYTHRVIDAQQMDFADNEVKAMFLIGVFHHFPDPAKFLREARRCLCPGGRLMLLEPTNNFFQRFLARHLNHYEYYDDQVADWRNETDGRMRQANLAMSHVMFFRDRERFEREFPTLRLKQVRYHTFMEYVLSGGMTYRSFLPSFAWPVVNAIEFAARPFMKYLGTAMTLDFVKTEG